MLVLPVFAAFSTALSHSAARLVESGVKWNQSGKEFIFR
jgi:hypothetical protein